MHTVDGILARSAAPGRRPRMLMLHEPVMAAEVLEWLQPRPGAVIADVTVGTGGHSAAIAPKLLPDGRLLAFDQDPEALEAARQRLAEFMPNVQLIQARFSELARRLAAAGQPQLDGVVADLGMSSAQVEAPARGFSFLKEGPLDMRMDPSQPTTAGMILQRASLAELTDLFRTFGEERYARRIAQRIVAGRRRDPLRTTTAFARLVWDAVPPPARRGRLHPATRVFQALRMAVNDEVGQLEALLETLPAAVRPEGRVVILSYHSLEGRLVKRAFASGIREGTWARLTKKAIRPSAEEVARNPRARSARLRAVRRSAS